MVKVITFGVQKGGVGKSTTSGIAAYLLSKEGYRVLVVDMDSQGNVSNLLLQMEQEDYEGNTILEAMADENIKPYIMKAAENLDVVPADDFLATLAKKLYTEWHYKNTDLVLRRILDPIKDQYDFIIIDTPPSLSEPMINAICASDHVIVLAESSKWAFTAIDRFIETVEFAAEKKNLNIDVKGILRTMNHATRADSKAFVELIGEEYPDLVFNTVIKRKAATGRIALEGLYENKEIKDALEEYLQFYEEFKERIGVNANVQS